MADRLFVALWPDASARASLRESVSAASQQFPDLRWQPEERWHLTLAFLGEADRTRAAEAIERRAGRLPQPEPIRMQGAGTFGPVLWVGLEHGPWLAAAARDLQRALHVEDRRFRAHVTVARARGRPADATRAARAAVPSLAGHTGPAWLTTELTLVASVTGPSPTYTVLHRWAWPAEPGPPG